MESRYDVIRYLLGVKGLWCSLIVVLRLHPGLVPEPLAELPIPVTPAKLVPGGFRPGAGVQKSLQNLDSGLRRNDAQGLLQEANIIQKSEI